VYVINEAAVPYWKDQELSAAVIQKLSQGPQQFVGAAAWQVRLEELAIRCER
jgi:hypothetical protein